jgi:hypothetical protein
MFKRPSIDHRKSPASPEALSPFDRLGARCHGRRTKPDGKEQGQ